MRELVIRESEGLKRPEKVERLQAAGFDLRKPYTCEIVELDGETCRRYEQEGTDV